MIKEGGKDDFYYNSKTNEIVFDPTSGLEVAPGQVQSPALGLLHEAGHAESDVTDPVQHAIDGATYDPAYDNKEERDVIENLETPSAKKAGETIRNNHGGTPVEVKDITSREKVCEPNCP